MSTRAPSPVRAAVGGAVVVALTTALAGLAAVLTAVPARATSCATHEAASADDLARGSEDLSVDVPFRDAYDGAVLGTVTQVRGPAQGPVQVTVDVTGWLGRPLPREVTVLSPDDGMMSGFGFAEGTHYLVPYVLRGGELHSFVCDPISVVPAADAAAVVAVALDHAWQGAAGLPAADPAPTTGTGGPGALALGAGTAGLTVLGGAAAVLLRRRSRVPAAAR